MSFVFDTLGYSKHLRHAVVSTAEAEAHAEAARDFIMSEIATRHDILAVQQDLTVVKDELRGMIETLGLRITVRLGFMVAAAVAALAAVIKL